jgi:hypothetical protein
MLIADRDMEPVAGRCDLEYPIVHLIASHQTGEANGVDRDLLRVRHQIAARVQHMGPQIDNGIDARVAEHGHSAFPFWNAFDKATGTTCTAGLR